MHRTCARFLQSPTQKPLASLLAGEPSNDLRIVALAFVQLQPARHSADYDLASEWTRSQAAGLVRIARDAFIAWKGVTRAEAEIFLLALFTLKQLDSMP